MTSAVGHPGESYSIAELDLLDWRRRIFELYRSVRSVQDPVAAWQRWRDTRDELFATHPQSPLAPEHRQSFSGLSYFDYDPAFRVVADTAPTEGRHFDITTSTESSLGFTHFAGASFELEAVEHQLGLYWLDGYGGGVLLPFRDGGSGDATYGGGRYLLDSVKGADLGGQGHGLVLDFNFAYNPSCVYDPRWVCPLAPPANRLDATIAAGEKAGGGASGDA